MTSHINWRSGLVIGIILCAGCASAQSQRSGTLKAIQGDVRLIQKDVSRDAALAGGVQETDRVMTGRNASTTFTLKDGTVVTMGPNTTLDLVKVRFDPVTQEGTLGLHLLKGVIRVVTGVLGKLHPDQVDVATPTSVVGVRGTDFIVEVP